MIDDFLLRAGAAGVGVALAAGPLGCFVLWRRMAYFGDATAHAAILGVALALLLSVSVTAAVLAVSLAMALAVSALAERGLAIDAALGVAAHGALAAGLVAVSLAGAGGAGDLHGYLFGEILAVSGRDLWVIWGGAAVVLGVLGWRWSALLAATLSADIAQAGGLDPARERRVLTVALAVVVAVALKVVGALLITAMLIIPAAAARPLARSPEAMAAIAAGLGVLAVVGGLSGSLLADTPAGPSVVTAATALFLLTTLAGRGQAKSQ